MSRVYERTVRSQQAIGGQKNCWAIGFPHECFIQKLLVKQTGGVLSDFTVNVYNSIKACGPPSASSGGGDPNGDYVGDPDDYLVFGPLQGNAGEYMRFDSEFGRAYKNRDGTFTSPKRFIYIQIEPAEAGEMTFDVTIGCHQDVG